MATKPVYLPKLSAPYRTVWHAEYAYNKGFAVSQKQKNIAAIHRAYTVAHPGKRVLEISSKSMQEGGTELSAFFLKKTVPSLGISVPVENVFQAGKVFAEGGPYEDLLCVTPREAKGDERLRTSGPLTGFRFEGHDFPLHPKTVFYDYLYINALLENKALADIVLSYDAFTDVEFNPEKSVNCQAKSAALFVSLAKRDLLDRTRDFDDFLSLFTAPPAPVTAAPEPIPASAPAEPDVNPGDAVQHTVWGMGTVTEVRGTIVVIRFDSVGEKKLGLDWIRKNCVIHPKGEPQ